MTKERKVRVGQVFEFLKIQEVINSYRCIVRCVCGKEKNVKISELVRGSHKSCGCKRSYFLSSRFSGLSIKHRKLFHVWGGICARCNNKNHIAYENYGGRGINVCNEWKTFDGFFKDMGVSYKSGLTIDRIDNDGNYCKENCRWITRKEQALNKRNTAYIDTPLGKMKLAEAVIVSGIGYGILKQRSRKLKWPAERMFDPPIYPKSKTSL
jgi:hypothetical protein